MLTLQQECRSYASEMYCFKSVVFRNMIRCVDICHSSAYTANGERKPRVFVGTLADRFQHFLCNCRIRVTDVTNIIIVNIPNPLKISTNSFIVFFISFCVIKDPLKIESCFNNIVVQAIEFQYKKYPLFWRINHFWTTSDLWIALSSSRTKNYRRSKFPCSSICWWTL